VEAREWVEGRVEEAAPHRRFVCRGHSTRPSLTTHAQTAPRATTTNDDSVVVYVVLLVVLVLLAQQGGQKKVFRSFQLVLIIHVILSPQMPQASAAQPEPSHQSTTSRATSSPQEDTKLPLNRGAPLGKHITSFTPKPCRGLAAYAREPPPPVLGRVPWPLSSSFVPWAACFSAGTLVRNKGGRDGRDGSGGERGNVV